MKSWIKDQKMSSASNKIAFCCAPYLHGSGDEGDLCPWIQVLVDDESTGPLTGPHHAAALDQHQQLGWVWQGIWAQVDKSGGFIFWSIHLNIQENTGYHWCELLSYLTKKKTFPSDVQLLKMFWYHRLLGPKLISALFMQQQQKQKMIKLFFCN